jgi:anti-anti-sigma regulatory factor
VTRQDATHDLPDSRAIDRHGGPSLGVAVAGDPSSRVVRVNGDLTARGAELLHAITDHFVRDGSRTVRMDLADVTTADHEGLQSVERLRTTLGQQGVTLLVFNRSLAVHYAASP